MRLYTDDFLTNREEWNGELKSTRLGLLWFMGRDTDATGGPADGGSDDDGDDVGMTGNGGFGGLGIGNPGSYGGQQSVGAPGFGGGYSGV